MSETSETHGEVEAPKEPSTQRMVYAGLRLADLWDRGSRVLHHLFYRVGEDGEIQGEARYLFSERKDPLSRLVVGACYEFTTIDKGIVVAGERGPKRLPDLELHEGARVWGVASQGARRVVSTRKSELKEADRDYISLALRPIKEAFDHAGSQERRAILAQVLEELYG